MYNICTCHCVPTFDNKFIIIVHSRIRLCIYRNIIDVYRERRHRRHWHRATTRSTVKGNTGDGDGEPATATVSERLRAGRLPCDVASPRVKVAHPRPAPRAPNPLRSAPPGKARHRSAAIGVIPLPCPARAPPRALDVSRNGPQSSARHSLVARWSTAVGFKEHGCVEWRYPTSIFPWRSLDVKCIQFRYTWQFFKWCTCYYKKRTC